MKKTYYELAQVDEVGTVVNIIGYYIYLSESLKELHSFNSGRYVISKMCGNDILTTRHYTLYKDIVNTSDLNN